MTGTKPVFRLQTKEGYSIRATADHRFMTPQGWVELQDLKVGDKIHIMNRKGGFGQEGSLELGRVLGWLVGDGTIKSNQVVLSFFGKEKIELAPMFAEVIDRMVAPLTVGVRGNYPVGTVAIPERDEVRVGSTRLYRLIEPYGLTENKFQVPEVVFRGSEDMQRGFLQALFTADGSFQDGRQKGGSIRLASSHLELLEQTQMILGNFGIASRIYKNRRLAQYRPMPDGKGESKLYWTKAQHELVITKRNMVVFSKEIGFLMDYKQESLTNYIERGSRHPYGEAFLVTIETIAKNGMEEVFDITEPITHSMVVNGLVAHQCGEQVLSDWSV
jgi:ribonucleoside-diphosphate reductase alpha chain